MAELWIPAGGLYSTGSDHFRPHEWACRSCGVAALRWDLVEALEALRSRHGGPIVLQSGFRCPAHNRAVGGADGSQHLYGLAVDLATPVSLEAALDVQLFSGIGSAGDRALHVDVRHVDPPTNWTGSTPAQPARWTY